MAKLNTIAIVHPDYPGERLTMNEKDFNPTSHVMWAEPSAEPDAPTVTIALPESDLSEPAETIDPQGVLNPPIPTIEEIEGMGWRAIKAYCEAIGLEGKGDESWDQFLIQHLYPST